MLGFSYVYDEHGLATEREVVSEEVTTTTQYTHDDLGRLTESVTGEYVATYGWDAASNLIAETVFDNLDSNLAEDGWETTRTVNAVNQVTEVVKDFVHHPQSQSQTTSYEYDERGNRVQEELTRTMGGTTHTLNEVEYSFDGQDQLVGLHDTGANQNNSKDDTVVAWERDGLGRALEVTENGDAQGRVFDGTAVVVEGDTRVTRAPTGEVLTEAFETVEGKNKKATTVTQSRELLTDLLGSTVTFADGGVIDADLTLFSDFGDVLTEPDWDTVTGFTGMPDTAGLAEFATRAYDPESRVWVQEDAYPGSITRASSMNRYAYVEGAPETYVDAWGMYRAASAVVAQQLSAVEYAVFMEAFAILANRGFQAELERARALDEINREYVDAMIETEGERSGLWLYGAMEVVGDKWAMTEDWAADLQARRERTSWYENTRDALTLTQSLEVSAGLGAIWFDNGQYYDQGSLCGVEMECFTETSFDYGLITLGHTVLARNPEITARDQVHEVGHVFDVAEMGAVVYYPVYGAAAVQDYLTDVANDLLTGESNADIHDSNRLEKRSERHEENWIRTGQLPDQGIYSDFWDAVL